KGGVFLYPPTESSPRGKLRVLYEAFPLAFLAEAAGGTASDGTRRILEITPNGLHDRTPLFIGNTDLVEDVVAAMARG
ncbi:MAG: fructose-1,6-bisphosphatase, partial [Myxococcota bacterium]|nr:fructose-1,6-bisphosphatase [Myxococcota bacterium]